MDRLEPCVPTIWHRANHTRWIGDRFGDELPDPPLGVGRHDRLLATLDESLDREHRCDLRQGRLRAGWTFHKEEIGVTPSWEHGALCSSPLSSPNSAPDPLPRRTFAA